MDMKVKVTITAKHAYKDEIFDRQAMIQVQEQAAEWWDRKYHI